MGSKELERLLDEETDASERTRDDPLSDRAARRRKTKSVVYSIRLTPEQTDEIQRIADDAGVPPSGLVRDWVLQGLTTERENSGAGVQTEALINALGRDLDRLRRHVAGHKAP